MVTTSLKVFQHSGWYIEQLSTRIFNLIAVRLTSRGSNSNEMAAVKISEEIHILVSVLRIFNLNEQLTVQVKLVFTHIS